MNFFEELLIDLLGAGESVATVFIHSKNGLAVLNATEPIVNGLITTAVQQTTAAAQKVPPTATTTTAQPQAA